MNEDWVETTLGSVAHFVNGYPFKPADLDGVGLPVIRIRQLLDPDVEPDRSDVQVPSRHHLHDGDLVFSWSGTLASRIWDRGPAVLNQHLFKVLERDGVSRGWLHLALDYAVGELSTKTHGTTMKHVTKKVLEEHPVHLPPLTVQQRIVDLMEHLDNQVRLLRAASEAAEKSHRALRAALFADWDARPLGEFCEIRARLVDPTRDEYADLMHIGVERIEKESGELLPLSSARSDGLVSGKYLFSVGDVIFSKIRPNLRKVVLVDFVGLCSADAYPLTPMEGLPPLLLSEALLLPQFTEAAIAKSGRTKMPKINRTELMSLEIPLASIHR